VALSFFLVRKPFVLPFWATGSLLIFAGYLAGYTGGAMGAYREFAGVFAENVPPIYVYTLASVVAIGAVEASPGIQRFLDNRFFSILGEISFPLYLVHLPVLFSAGCWAFLAAQPYDPQLSSWIGTAVTIISSFVLAAPMMLLNRRWLGTLNRFMERAVPLKPISPSPGIL
jgi:peptidoglycan/LPS O-acetylase OafA/YrhL